MASSMTMQEIISDPVIQAFTASLSKALGTSLKELWLFGSRARGDNEPDSDYDILVVAEGSMAEVRWLVAEETYAILDQFEEFIGPVVYSPEIWEHRKKHPLGKNVLADGIRVA